VSRLAELGSDGVLLLCGDSTNADRPGFSPSERTVGPHLEEVFARADGRIVGTSFASNIHRVQQVVDAATALDRKVCLVGRSMRKNVNIGRTLGHIVVPEGTLVPPRELDQWADDRIVIISTGSQGEPLSALRRMAHGDHPNVDLREGDMRALALLCGLLALAACRQPPPARPRPEDPRWIQPPQGRTQVQPTA